MATTFSGPVRIGKADNSSAWPALIGVTVTLTPTAAASTDYTVKVPKGRIVRIVTQTDTAYTGNTVTAQVGTTSGGAEIVAAATVKSAGTVDHTLVAGAQNATIAADSTLYVRLAQTATVTAVGAGLMTITMVPLA
jgi:hypothetical protein